MISFHECLLTKSSMLSQSVVNFLLFGVYLVQMLHEAKSLRSLSCYFIHSPATSNFFYHTFFVSTLVLDTFNFTLIQNRECVILYILKFFFDRSLNHVYFVQCVKTTRSVISCRYWIYDKKEEEKVKQTCRTQLCRYQSLASPVSRPLFST
jgi:hypothetical protein